MTSDRRLKLSYGHPDTVSVHRLMSTIILILGVAGCSMVARGADPNPDPDVYGLDPNGVIEDEPSSAESIFSSASEPEAGVEAPVPMLDTRSWAERTLEQLTIEEKAGQLLMPWVLGDFAPEGSEGHERIFNFVEDLKIGGLIMSVGTPFGVAAKLNALQAHSDLPLLVAADLETGAGFRMRGAVQMPGTIDLGGATDFPSLMAVGATGNEEFAYEMGRITAVEARALGVHVPFAPVLDVNNNPDNPIINVRSFGEDPQQVAEMGVAFVRGVQDNGAIATGKHFPGHGDTDVDSHVGLPVILHDRARMDSVELKPFRRAIDSGMRAIMTAHISVPSLNGGGREPSTLSPEVLTEILRDELGFGGIVFTDAMDMSAVASQFRSGEAAVRALEAGADVILMPASVGGAIEGIVEAVRSGRLTEDRLDLSVMRVLETKEGVGLHEDRYVSLEEIPSTVGIPEHEEVADQIARESITLLQNGNDLLPLAGTRSARVMSVSYRRSSDVLAGRYFNRAMRETYPRLRAIEVDGDTSDDRYRELRRVAREQAFVVVGTYVTSVNVSGSFTLPEELVEFVRYLGQIGVPHTVVSFGNPYLVADFPDVRSYLLAWSGSEASQRAAAAAMLGQAPIAGRIPTRIPPFFEIGDGLQIPKIGSSGGTR